MLNLISAALFNCVRTLTLPIATYTQILTLALLCLSLTGCAFLEGRYGEQCNSQAYVASDIEGYIKQRFHRDSPVRVGVFPFTPPANLAVHNIQVPGLGIQLAGNVQAELLRAEAFPITEVINRSDWPGKREEFFTGNFGALLQGRNAGYDLIVVGFIENITDQREFSVYSKVIEVESGTTLWFGKTTVTTYRPRARNVAAWVGIENRRPDLLEINPRIERAASCIVEDLLRSSREDGAEREISVFGVELGGG